MYAIFEAKGKQFRAEPEATLRLPSLDAEPGERVTFDHVLVTGRDDEIQVGRPALEGAAVAVEVVRHGRGDKIIVYKMKRRKGYRKKQGHRQGFTEVRIVDIEFGTGRPAAGPEAAERGSARKAAGKRTAKPAKAPEAGTKAQKAETKAQKAGTKAQKAETKAPEAEAKTPEAEAPEPAAIEATDTARSLAEEHGIDLATIEGTGKEGRILKSDVEKAIKEREGS